MAIKKIPCGGFYYDDETIEFEDGVMKVIGGGSGGGAMIVEFDVVGEGDFTATHTPQQVAEAMLLQPVIGILKLDGVAMPIGSPWTNGFMFDKLYIYFGSHNDETYSAMAVWRGNVETNEWEPFAP